VLYFFKKLNKNKEIISRSIQKYIAPEGGIKINVYKKLTV